jgi:multicomponent Na+:H+ antiporter subunit E
VAQHTIALALILALIWLLLSGHWTHPVLLPLGAASVALVVYLARRTRVSDREGLPLHLLGRAARYWRWLLVQMVKANLTVARHVLAGNHTLSPRLSRIRNSQKTELGRTILANAITLTPGTVTIDVSEEEIVFYALTEDIERDLLEGEMDRRTTEFEGAT